MRLGYRYYDASTGRFLSRDPIRDGYNWYVYCENDPVNAVDRRD
jgi:RHS repeat-associated protein